MIRTFVALLALLTILPLRASAQDRGRIRRIDEGPRAVVEADFEVARDHLARATFPARVEIPLSEHFRDSVITGDGAVALVQLGGQPTLVTPYSWIAGASSLQIEIDGVWLDARPQHASLWHDLAALVIDVPLPEDRVPLELSTEFPLDPLLFVATPAGTADAEVAATAFGIPPGDTEAWYIRALTPLRNGFAIIDRDGRLVAITSIAARDRHDGTYALSFDRIGAWQEAWDSIDRGEEWDFRVIEETVNPTTGVDALR